jgi:hypothetical protein
MWFLEDAGGGKVYFRNASNNVAYANSYLYISHDLTGYENKNGKTYKLYAHKDAKKWEDK